LRSIKSITFFTALTLVWALFAVPAYVNPYDYTAPWDASVHTSWDGSQSEGIVAFSQASNDKGIRIYDDGDIVIELFADDYDGGGMYRLADNMDSSVDWSVGTGYLVYAGPETNPAFVSNILINSALTAAAFAAAFAFVSLYCLRRKN
jgi:hypothetical protein